MSDGTLVVRRAELDDWSTLRAIRLEALLDTPDAYGSTYEAVVTYPEEQWRAMVEQSVYFLAERGGRAVGMVSGGLNDQHPGTRWLYGIYVMPRSRGGEVAPNLVAAVIDWAKAEGASELYLHVTSSVARAKAFYEKMGFAPTGERQAMQRDRRLTLLTMKKSLVRS